MTFHKAQGQTLQKVILDINHRPGKSLGMLSFYALYVEISRVQQSNDIRILPLQPKHNWKHLQRLIPNAELFEWINSTSQI